MVDQQIGVNCLFTIANDAAVNVGMSILACKLYMTGAASHAVAQSEVATVQLTAFLLIDEYVVKQRVVFVCFLHGTKAQMALLAEKSLRDLCC